MRGRLDHALPPWVDPEETFFVTLCAQNRQTNHFCKAGVGENLLNSVRHYHVIRKWFCSIVVLMPDHVHLIVNVALGGDLAKTVGSWKRWTTKKFGVRWEKNFFDHRLRHNESAEGTWRYIEGNPVRAGLVERPEEWPWLWYPDEE